MNPTEDSACCWHTHFSDQRFVNEFGPPFWVLHFLFFHIFSDFQVGIFCIHMPLRSALSLAFFRLSFRRAMGGKLGVARTDGQRRTWTRSCFLFPVVFSVCCTHDGGLAFGDLFAFYFCRLQIVCRNLCRPFATLLWFFPGNLWTFPYRYFNFFVVVQFLWVSTLLAPWCMAM